MNSRRTLLWMQSGGCGGCSLSLLNAESPNLFTALESAGIDLLWHPAISEESGEELMQITERILSGELQLDLFCLEGAVIQGPNGTGMFHRQTGGKEPMRNRIRDLALAAKQVIAIGSCAAFGGMTAAGDNPTEACGLQYSGSTPGGLLGREFRSDLGLPVINIAGCPIHPNWVLQTLMQLTLDDTQQLPLDELNRPRSYTDHLVHHGCPRNEYYEFKASAEKHSDLGCMMEHLGCLGTQARADCNILLWNGEGSCLRGGYACVNCTAPLFEKPGHSFQNTPKIAGIPIGLPTDMPKAWFVALAALAKAATPTRLKENAVIDHIDVVPGKKANEK